jgi:hypothetical protein
LKSLKGNPKMAERKLSLFQLPRDIRRLTKEKLRIIIGFLRVHIGISFKKIISMIHGGLVICMLLNLTTGDQVYS